MRQTIEEKELQRKRWKLQDISYTVFWVKVVCLFLTSISGCVLVYIDRFDYYYIPLSFLILSGVLHLVEEALFDWHR